MLPMAIMADIAAPSGTLILSPGRLMVMNKQMLCAQAWMRKMIRRSTW